MPTHNWFSKDVGDGIQASEPTSRLHEAFMALAISGNTSPDIGVFSRYDLQANIVTWYFSPEASSLAATFGATSCEKPEPQEGFGLLVGNARSWEAHFPGYIGGRKRK